MSFCWYFSELETKFDVSSPLQNDNRENTQMTTVVTDEPISKNFFY